MKNDTQKSISRKQFLTTVGTGITALVIARFTGVFDSMSSRSSLVKNTDVVGYGNSAYGGGKKV